MTNGCRTWCHRHGVDDYLGVKRWRVFVYTKNLGLDRGFVIDNPDPYSTVVLVMSDWVLAYGIGHVIRCEFVSLSQCEAKRTR
jgi:hypothetical protein